MQYFERIVIVAFVLIAIFLGIDIYDDLLHGSDLGHVLAEGIALLVSLAMLSAYILSFARYTVETQRTIASTLTHFVLERDRWRKQSEQYLKGLGMAIDAQFELWHLTEAEKAIGLLMLKGLAHKEIAGVRNTSEKTVRQQATSLYAKAGVENKSQLSAFFLEDLMLPQKSGNV
jgi:DNA-binding NarL/FixJ family response regulator